MRLCGEVVNSEVVKKWEVRGEKLEVRGEKLEGRRSEGVK